MSKAENGKFEIKSIVFANPDYKDLNQEINAFLKKEQITTKNIVEIAQSMAVDKFQFIHIIVTIFYNAKVI